MMTMAVFGQDQSDPGDALTLDPVDVVIDAVGEPDPIVIDDGYEIGDGGWPDDPADGGTDDGSNDGSDGGTDDGGVVDEGERVSHGFDGDVGITGLPAEAYQNAAAGPRATGNAASAARSRVAVKHPIAAGAMADCLVLHPQWPWICEFLYGAGP